ACKKMESDLADLEIQAQENEKMKKKVQDELMREKNDFTKKWKADNSMQEVFSTRDQGVAEAFGYLLTKAEKRENKIDEVTFKLREELGVLSDFLNEIASRPPNAISEVHKKKKKRPEHIEIVNYERSRLSVWHKKVMVKQTQNFKIYLEESRTILSTGVGKQSKKKNIRRSKT
ncbi:unnamed protein product, partial [Candidula unifasciata]